MFFVKDKIIVGMALMRVLSSLIELTAAILIFKIGKVETALKINATLALVGPIIMIIVTTIGLVGLAGKIPYWRIAVIFVGVCLIFGELKRFRLGRFWENYGMSKLFLGR